MLLLLKPSSFEEAFLSIATETFGHISLDEFKSFALATEALDQSNAILQSSENIVAQELNVAAPKTDISEEETLAVEMPLENTRDEDNLTVEAPLETHAEETLAVEIPLEDTRGSPGTMEMDSTLSVNNMWDKILDEESGAYYYQNKETLETSWEPPIGYLEEPQNELSSAKGKRRTTYHLNKKPLEKILDEESGSYYYQNSITFETSWEVPEDYDGM